MILALDLAIHTGYALINKGTIVESGVWDMSDARNGGHNGHLFKALYERLFVIDKNYFIKKICYEKGFYRGHASTLIGMGLASTALLFCAKERIKPLSPVPPISLKKWATGNAKASKEDMMRRATELTGKVYESNDEADSVLLAYYCWEKESK